MRPVGSNPTAPSRTAMGRSHSGLVRRFAKPLGGQPPRGFESLPPRQVAPAAVAVGAVLFVFKAVVTQVAPLSPQRHACDVPVTYGTGYRPALMQSPSPWSHTGTGMRCDSQLIVSLTRQRDCRTPTCAPRAIRSGNVILLRAE